MDRVDISMMDPQMASLSTPPYPDMPQQEDVDEYLKKKRKAREHKACYPCRQRKVKCDLTRPCQTCRDRDHPQLCSYHPPNKRQSLDESPAVHKVEEMTANANFVTLGRDEFNFLCRKLSVLEESIADLRREMKRSTTDHGVFHETDSGAGANIDPAVNGRAGGPTHADMHGLHVKDDSGNIVHVGGGSIPAMLYSLQMNQGRAEQHQIQEMLGKTVLPIFGLDNESATYPFVDLWGLPHGSIARVQEIAKALPGDSQMLSLFRCYRDLGYVIYAGIESPEQLEADMGEFLITRATQTGSVEGVTEQQIYGKSLNWVALMFAVLASGVQCSQMSRKERELTSQVYTCCSFECLRITNFLSQCTLEGVQSLIVIGNVMTNNLNAGTSWSMLGLTIRLAQGLGIHQPCPPHVPNEVSFRRAKVWWAILWQESLLSITYDRASAAVSLDSGTMPPPQNLGSIGAYHAVMYQLSRVGLEIVRDRARLMTAREQIARIAEHRDALAKIVSEAAEYLRDSRKCNTPRETLEHWGLYLHSSYNMAELCRPAINPNADSELAKAFKQTCVDNLINTIEAFLGLNNITSFARQSWAALHRALGSALLLGIIGEHNNDQRARKLVGRFINVMADITNSVDPQEISAPIQRGLSALRKLGIHEAAGSQFANGVAGATSHDGAAVDENGSLKLNQAFMMTPSSSDTTGGEEERSPYSVLNTILWGNTGGYPA